MAVNPSIEPLDCGRDAAAVWDRAAAGVAPDAHERTCPHCIAVAADARGLDSVVHRMATQALEPPPAVLERVMGAVTSQPRGFDALTLPSPYGPVLLSGQAAAAVLRHAVDRMVGVRARSCRVDQPAEPGGSPHATTVAITVTARYGLDLPSVAARVRQMVIAAGEQVLGVPVEWVDIEVVDVFEAGTP